MRLRASRADVPWTSIHTTTISVPATANCGSATMALSPPMARLSVRSTQCRPSHSATRMRWLFSHQASTGRPLDCTARDGQPALSVATESANVALQARSAVIDTATVSARPLQPGAPLQLTSVPGAGWALRVTAVFSG